MGFVRFENAVTTLIREDATATDTTLKTGPLLEGIRWPDISKEGDYFIITVVNIETKTFEICRCTAVVTSDDGADLSVIRGEEGTTPLEIKTGFLIENRLTAETLNKVGNPPIYTPSLSSAGDLSWTWEENGGTPVIESGNIRGPKGDPGNDGIPLFTITPTAFHNVQDGCLSITVDNGLLTRDAFPQAYDQLVIFAAAGESNILTLDAYQQQMDNNGGICGSFALDSDTSTFRIPCAPGAYWRGASEALGLDVGQYQIDQIRPITGHVPAYMWGSHPQTIWGYGAFVPHPVIPAAQGGSNTGSTGSVDRGFQLDTSLLGPNFQGTDTHPTSVICDYQMKMYGAVTEAGEANIAALVAATTIKLDTSRYETDRKIDSVKAFVSTSDANGTIKAAKNVVMVSLVSKGTFNVVLAPNTITDYTTAFVIVSPHGASLFSGTISAGFLDNNTVRVCVYAAGGAYSNPFSMLII